MGSMRVLVTPRPFDSKGQEHLQRLRDAGYEVEWNDTGKRYTREDLEDRIGNADALLTGNDPLDQDMLARAKKLMVISKYGVGLDNIDLTCAKEMGISVYKALGANSDAVAEFAVLLMMAAQRQLYQLSQGAKSREALRLVGHEAAGKAIGLVGLGAIGHNVARIARALGMSVLAYDPAVSQANAPEGVMCVTFDNLLASSDVISLHAPLTASTSGLIGADEFAAMKPTAILVNTARAGLVDADALYSALSSGQIAFAAEDIELKERPDAIVALDNYLITPHAASFTVEADQKTMAVSVDNIIKGLEQHK